MTDTNNQTPADFATVVAIGAAAFVDFTTFGSRPFCSSFLEASRWKGRDALAGLAWLLQLLEHELFEDPAPAVQNAPWRTEEAWRRLREAYETVRDELNGRGSP